jgi:WD40 repeat protein
MITELRDTTKGRITPELLAMAAARKGMRDLAHQAANQLGSSPLTWQPRWTKGERPSTGADPSVRLLKNFRRRVRDLTVSADGSSLTLIARDFLAAWNPGEPDTTIKAPGNPAIGVSRNGQRAVLATAAETRVIDVQRRETTWTYETGLAAKPAVAAVNDTGSVVVLVANGQVHSLRNRSLTALGSIDPDRPVAATTGFGTPVVAWAGPGDLVSILLAGKQFPIGSNGTEVRAITMAEDAKLVVWSTEHSVVVWDRQSGGERTLLRCPQGVHPTAIALSDTNDVVAVGYNTGRVALYRIDSAELIADHREYLGPVTAVAMSDDGMTLTYVVSERVLLWQRAKMSDAPQGFSAVAVVPELPEGDPRLAVVGDSQGWAQPVLVNNGVKRGPAHKDKKPVESIDFQRTTGHVLARITWRGGRVGLLDPVRGSLYDADHFAGLSNVERRFAITNQTVEVAGDSSGAVVLLSAGSKSVIETLGRHDRGVTKVVCGELEGRPVAFTGSLDKTVRVWDLSRREQVDVLEFEGEVHDLDVSPTGDLLVCAGGELIAFQHVSTVKP